MSKLQDYEILPWEAYNRAPSLHDFLHRALEWISEPALSRIPWNCSFTINEEKEKIVVRLELVGMKREDFEIELKDGLLTIAGDRKISRQGEEGEPLRRERFFGRFSRSVSLPTRVDESVVSAYYQEGILVVNLPKVEEAKSKRVIIHTS